MAKVSLIPSVFTGVGKPGDFKWEIQTQYRGKAALYVFNDNVEEHGSARPGAGNAVIRPWNRYGACAYSGKILAAGVSTGMSAWEGGFEKLTADVCRIIDADLAEIRSLLATGEYAHLVYSAHARDSEMLGTGIFSVCKEVRYYIVSELRKFERAMLGQSQPHPEFEGIRQRFLRQHEKSIRKALSECFEGKIVLDPTPLGHAVMNRFCKCYREHCSPDASCMLPALHGTDTKNYASICQRGLLIPGHGNNIKVEHGSAYGLGIYTSKLSNPGLSQGFCTQPNMLICCVIDDTCASSMGQTKSSYPIRYSNPKHRNGKHPFEYVDELDVWYEWDYYAYYDIWSDQWKEEPRAEPSNIVKHVRDSIVIFDPSHVLPLFIARGSRWARSFECDCDYCLGISDCSDFVVHDRLMYWPRGWVARHGKRKMLSSPRGLVDNETLPMRTSRKGSHAYTCTWQKVAARSKRGQLQHPGSPEPSDSRQSHARKARARASLKRQVQHDLAEVWPYGRLI